jgi:hypothetical protein
MIGDTQPLVRRDDVDLVRFQPGGVLDLHDRHVRLVAEDGGKFAMKLRIEMDHDDEGGAGILGQGMEQRLQRADAAGGRADADDRRAGCLNHACTPETSSKPGCPTDLPHRDRFGGTVKR